MSRENDTYFEELQRERDYYAYKLRKRSPHDLDKPNILRAATFDIDPRCALYDKIPVNMLIKTESLRDQIVHKPDRDRQIEYDILQKRANNPYHHRENFKSSDLD